MSEKYRPIKGDRVRVVLEGDVTYALPDDPDSKYDGYFELEGKGLWPSGRAVVSVEKIEFPIEVFKPGDRIRRTDGWDFEITLADNGYIHHSKYNQDFYRPYGPGQQENFNSKRYELVYRP